MRNHSLKAMEAKIEAEYQLPLADVVRGYVVDDGVSLSDTAAILEVKHAALVAYCRIKGIVPKGREAKNVRQKDHAVRVSTAASVMQHRRESDPISFARIADALGMNRDAIRMRFNRLGDLRQATNRNFEPRRPGRRSKEN